MKLKELSPDMAVSPQISSSDVDKIKQLGYTVIVCNRPDNESKDQVNFEEINSAANGANIKAIYQPVVAGKIGPRDIDTFKTILSEAGGPVLAYCRTGNRSEMLWVQAASHARLN